jgi:hypothetical protein
MAFITASVAESLRLIKEGREVTGRQAAWVKRLEFAVQTGEDGLLKLTQSGEVALEKAMANGAVTTPKPVEKRAVKSGRKAKLAARDAELAKKYPHFIPGSLRRVDGQMKLMAEIKCQTCDSPREVFTSDIFQIKECLKCRAHTAKTGKGPKAKPKRKKK